MPLLRCSPTHALLHPRALRHRSSKSRRMRGKPRGNTASCRARDVSHGPDIPVRARHALQPCPPPCAALDALPTFDTDLLSVAPLTLTCLMLLADTPLLAFFDQFLVARLQIDHLAHPQFISVPPGPGEVRSTAVPHLTMYYGLCSSCLFDMLGSKLKELMLVLAP